MRVITTPSPVKIELPRVTGKTVDFVDSEVSFQTFLQECLDSYDIFSKGHVNALLYAKLSKIITDSDKKTGELWFEDEDFKKLEAAVSVAKWITPKINAAYIPFYEAVKTARTETLASDKASK